MVDLSVVGLLIALHHLATTGTHPDQLRSARWLMHLCGLLTLALNTAEPLLAHHWGRAALDTVAPTLLLGWGTVGPTLLRHLHHPPAPPSASTPNPDTDCAQDTAPRLPVGDDNAMLTLASAAGVLPDEWSGALDDPRPAQTDAPPISSRDTPAGEGVQFGHVGEEPAAGRDKPGGRPPGAQMAKLREIGLQAATAEGKLTRAVVEQAVRAAGLSLASNRLTELMNDLRPRWNPEAGRPRPRTD